MNQNGAKPTQELGTLGSFGPPKMPWSLRIRNNRLFIYGPAHLQIALGRRERKEKIYMPFIHQELQNILIDATS